MSSRAAWATWLDTVSDKLKKKKRLDRVSNAFDPSDLEVEASLSVSLRLA